MQKNTDPVVNLACPACGYYTVADTAYGSYNICKVCDWEDDQVQLANPALGGGANLESLIEMQAKVLALHPLYEINTSTSTKTGIRRDPLWRPLTVAEVEACELEVNTNKMLIINKGIVDPKLVYWHQEKTNPIRDSRYSKQLTPIFPIDTAQNAKQMGQYTGPDVLVDSMSRYLSGGIATFRLKVRRASHLRQQPETFRLELAAIGTLTTDTRWLKFKRGESVSDLLAESGSLPESLLSSMMDGGSVASTGKQHSNRALSNTSVKKCIFCTNICTLYIDDLFQGEDLGEDSGTSKDILVMFDLPEDTLPSFKGLSMYTQYYLQVLLVYSSERVEKALFPFVVHGKGSAQVPYTTRFSNITTASKIPPEVGLVHPTRPDPAVVFTLNNSASSANTKGYNSNDDNDLLSDASGEFANDAQDVISVDEVTSGIAPGGYPLGAHAFTITDRDNICSLTILRAGLGAHIYPGDELIVKIDMLHAVQRCDGIRAKLLQYEHRVSDDSRIQEKVMSVVAKSTQNAALLTLQISVPLDATISFDSPLCRLRYKLEFSFFVVDSKVGKEDFFNWHLPITICSAPNSATIGNIPAAYDNMQIFPKS